MLVERTYTTNASRRCDDRCANSLTLSNCENLLRHFEEISMATHVQTTGRERETARGADKDRARAGIEDLLPVGSRVSWGAIFAGAVTALAIYLVLTLLGGAIGLTVSDDVGSGAMASGAAFWAILTTAAALFLGGWVTTQCTVGENKIEAVVHGLLMWGVVLFMMLWLVSTGMRAGFAAMWGVASFTSSAAENTSAEDWEVAAQRAGVSQATIADWKQTAANAPEDAREAVSDPANREVAAEYATRTTWYTLIGTVLSMTTAILGAIVGAGPTMRLLVSRMGVARAAN
jgi:hypothetical protein